MLFFLSIAFSNNATAQYSVDSTFIINCGHCIIDLNAAESRLYVCEQYSDSIQKIAVSALNENEKIKKESYKNRKMVGRTAAAAGIGWTCAVVFLIFLIL